VLIKHLGEKKQLQIESSATKNLLEAGNEDSQSNSEPIWLILTTKKHITDTKRLKPGKIRVPHSLNRAESSICLITADPQRKYKDVIAHELFPAELRSQIRILGLEKVKKRYKSFESRRQLVAEYDTFLADDRVITSLPKLLGKTVYESSKRPIPVSFPNPKPQKSGSKDSSSEKPISPQAMAKEIEKALSSARIHLAPSVTTSVHVGYSHFTAEQLEQNISAVVEGMVEKFIPKGWRNVRSIHVKGPTSAALPIWQASELWVDEEDVLEDQEAEKANSIAAQKGKRKQRGGGGGGGGGEEGGTEADVEFRPKKKLLGNEDGFNKEMADRREALRKQKRQARAELENARAAPVVV
jgi:ribosome biogenesis protein UTP30